MNPDINHLDLDSMSLPEQAKCFSLAKGFLSGNEYRQVMAILSPSNELLGDTIIAAMRKICQVKSNKK